MARRATIIGTTTDFEGSLWDVRESRNTKHGFSLLFGWPSGRRGPGWGGPRLIPTQDLLAYFAAVRLRRDGAIYDLPAAATTIKRIRRLLGLDYYCDNAEWWLDRLEDLSSMSGVRFSQVHGVEQSMVSEMHTRFLGKRNREPNWWREEPNAELLKSDLPRAYVADRLGISIGAVGRLRWILRKQ